MTKKDYELIAQAIFYSHQSLGDLAFNECIEGIERAAVILADHLQAENPKFKRDKFLKACGINNE